MAREGIILMSKKKSKKKNKKDSTLIEQGTNQVEKKLDSNILGNSNVRALITASVAAVVEQLLELLTNQENGSKDGRDGLSELGDAIKQDSNQVEKKFDASNILGNSSVRALITALAVAGVEQLLEVLVNKYGDSKDGDSRLSKLGDTIKDAALSLQGVVEGKSGLTETVTTVRDAIAEIKPVVAGVVPVVQGVVSALKDKADDGKETVQKALSKDSDDIQETITTVSPTS